MGIQKLRSDAVAMGKLYFGADGDAGIQRSAAGTLQILGSNGAAPGTVDSPVVLTPSVTGGTLNMQNGRVRVGTVAAALGTTTTMPSDVPGHIRLGHSGGTFQIGFTHNGTTVVMSIPAGTGPVTWAANPA